MPTPALKLSKGQLEAARRLLKGERMYLSKTVGGRYLPADGHLTYNAPRFTSATLESMLAKDLIFLAEDRFGSKDYVLNESRRAELEAYLGTDPVRALMYKLTTAQTFIVERMKKGWELFRDERANNYLLREPKPTVGNSILHPVTASTVQGLLALDILAPGELLDRRQWFTLNRDVLVENGL
jgi:hypothetical protein